MRERQSIDRKGWPSGPWDNEPDRFEWRSQGFPCLAARSHVGAWCGYVAVPHGHPWHGKGYADIDTNAHGGLTYSGSCTGRICHIPEPGESDNVWWLGFDCAHAGDLYPGGHPLFTDHPWIYRTLDYVRAEVDALALHAAGQLPAAQ